MADDFDLIILGGGMAGVTAAGQAAANGSRVALVERDQFEAGTLRPEAVSHA